MTTGWRRFLQLPRSLRRIDREIDAELRFHLASRIDDLVRAGHAPDGARELAYREFGDVHASRIELAEVDRRQAHRARRADRMEAFRQDLAYAVRGMRRQPGFAATVVVLLALAIGANATIFSLVDRLLLKPPSGITDPESVRRLYANFPASAAAVNGRSVNRNFSYPEFLSLQQELAGVARVAAYGTWDSTAVSIGADTIIGSQGYATADFLPMLGVRPTAGRFFVPAEDAVLAPVNVAVLTPRFAKRAFSEANPIGRDFVARGRRYTVIGLVPDDFHGIDISHVDFWTPFSTRRPVNDTDRRWHARQEVFIPLVVRLDSAITDAALEARATLAYRRAWTTRLKAYQGRLILAGPIISARGPMKRGQDVSIATRLAAVAVIVLLVACANVANLLLLRTAARRREIAVRLSLGISRSRLVGQFLVESLVLATVAGVAAVLMSIWVGAVLRAAILPRVQWVGSPVTLRVLVFTAIATAAVALLAGLAPSLVAGRHDLADSLRGGARDGVTRTSWLRGALLSSQVALSLVLLAGAGLFLASLRNVTRTDLGYDTQQLVIASLYHPDQKPHPETAITLPEVAARIAVLPGVRIATYATGLPLNSWTGGIDLFAPGRDSAVADIETAYNGVTPEYFDATGTRIVAGRAFRPSDTKASEPVMIVSRRLADAAWPGENPLGKCLMVDSRTAPCSRIVGVAEDVHAFRIIEDPEAQFYLPIAQVPHPWYRALVARTDEGAAAEVALAVRKEMRAAFPGAIITARAAEDILAPQMRPWRLGAALFSAMGGLSLVVAAIGLYSIVAFGMQQRAHEIGVRLALGAGKSDLARLVARHSFAPIFAGLVVGVIAALASGRFVASLLYGIDPRDPAVLAVAASLMFAAGLIASTGPLRRALRVDPATVLRET